MEEMDTIEVTVHADDPQEEETAELETQDVTA